MTEEEYKREYSNVIQSDSILFPCNCRTANCPGWVYVSPEQAMEMVVSAEVGCKFDELQKGYPKS